MLNTYKRFVRQRHLALQLVNLQQHRKGAVIRLAKRAILILTINYFNTLHSYQGLPQRKGSFFDIGHSPCKSLFSDMNETKQFIGIGLAVLSFLEEYLVKPLGSLSEQLL